MWSVIRLAGRADWRVGSKYGGYWAGLLPQIRVQVQAAVSGEPTGVCVPGLTRLGHDSPGTERPKYTHSR